MDEQKDLAQKLLLAWSCKPMDKVKLAKEIGICFETLQDFIHSRRPTQTRTMIKIQRWIEEVVQEGEDGTAE